MVFITWRLQKSLQGQGFLWLGPETVWNLARQIHVMCVYVDTYTDSHIIHICSYTSVCIYIYMCVYIYIHMFMDVQSAGTFRSPLPRILRLFARRPARGTHRTLLAGGRLRAFLS